MIILYLTFCFLFFFLQVDFTAIETLINLSSSYQKRLRLNNLKNNYFTVIFQILLIIALLSSFYTEWKYFTNFILIIAACVALIGAYVTKSGYFALIFSRKNRELESTTGFEGESFNRYVRTCLLLVCTFCMPFSYAFYCILVVRAISTYILFVRN